MLLSSPRYLWSFACRLQEKHTREWWRPTMCTSICSWWDRCWKSRVGLSILCRGPGKWVHLRRETSRLWIKARDTSQRAFGHLPHHLQALSAHSTSCLSNIQWVSISRNRLPCIFLGLSGKTNIMGLKNWQMPSKSQVTKCPPPDATVLS